MGAVAVAIVTLGCGTDRSSEEEQAAALSPDAASLYVRPDSFDFSSNPELLERITSAPHRYFRFINIPFSRLVCERFGYLIEEGPLEFYGFPSNLHGDAHIEQYAVTDLGRGLTDFDDSSRGPPWVDGLRFAVSLRLAARQNEWPESEDDAVREFRRGYTNVLADSTIEAPMPAVAVRIQKALNRDEAEYLRWVDSIMAPLEPDHERRLRDAMVPYADLMIAQEPVLGPEFFVPVRVGSLRLGVGSALEPKYLARLRGASDDPMDDVVLELKRVRSLSGIPCVQAAEDDPFRVLVSGARIAYRPFRFLGYVEFDDQVFWTHAWVANYEEIEVGQSFESPAELLEVAYDVGVQLGLGHLRGVGGPFERMVRATAREHDSEVDRDLFEGSRVLADAVVEAWERFVEDANTAGQ